MAWHDASDTALHATPDLEASIARCRVLLSAIAIVAVYVDPTHPTLTRWVPLRGGAFTIDGLGAAFVTRGNAFRSYPWAGAMALVDDAMQRLQARP